MFSLIFKNQGVESIPHGAAENDHNPAGSEGGQSSQTKVAESKQLALPRDLPCVPFSSFAPQANRQVSQTSISWLFCSAENDTPLKGLPVHRLSTLPRTSNKDRRNCHRLLVWCVKCAAYPQSSGRLPQTKCRDDFATSRLMLRRISETLAFPKEPLRHGCSPRET